MAGAAAPSAWGPATARASDVGRRYPPERRTLTDEVTGVEMTALTTSPANDDKIYQTHPSWTADGQYVLFHSDRGRDRRRQIFAVSEKTGHIIQLTDADDAPAGGVCLARRSMRMYYYRGSDLIELELDTLLRESDRASSSAPEPGGHERVVASLPAGTSLSGTFTLDANDRRAYVGLKLPGKDAWGIRAVDLETGATRRVIDVPFRVGHCQANPARSGWILYCHETGGDAPQRMWQVRADGTGNRPLYEEKPYEWVTHEVWWDGDHVLFTISGHQPELRAKPHGLASIDVRTNTSVIHDRYPYWHCTGTTDRKWAVGDTFGGALYMVELATGKRRLLSTGHRPAAARPHAHQSMSPDGKRVLFCSGRLGSSDLMVITMPKFETLPE